MEFKTVFFAMMATLIFLLLVGGALKRREKGISKIETDYYIALKSYRQNPTPEKKSIALELSKIYCAAKGLDESQTQSLLDQDFKL
jgi:hypothetical protein